MGTCETTRGLPSAKVSILSEPAQELIVPGQTPCQQAKALNQQQLSPDAVKAMANGLPERDSVWWASQSARKVANPAHVPDLEAIQAAEAWAKNPTPQAQQVASLAAQKAGFQTPGAWAAQGAAWAGAGGGLTAQAVTGAVLLAAGQAGKPIPPPVAAADFTKPQIAAPKLAAELAKPQASKFQLPFFKKPALEAPKLAVPGPDGLSLTPPQRAEMAKNVQPYLDLGCDVGSGKNSWRNA